MRRWLLVGFMALGCSATPRARGVEELVCGRVDELGCGGAYVTLRGAGCVDVVAAMRGAAIDVEGLLACVRAAKSCSEVEDC